MNIMSEEKVYDEQTLYGDGPYALMQVVCGNGRATVISRPFLNNLPDDLAEYPVHKGPFSLGACLNNLLYDELASGLGFPVLRRKVIRMQANPKFKCPLGTRRHLDEFEWFLIMENAVHRAGFPRDQTIPLTNYKGDGKLWSKETILVDHEKLRTWLEPGNFIQCSESLFKLLILDIILGIKDLAKRNYAILKNGETFRFDTDSFNLGPEDHDLQLGRFIKEKQAKAHIFELAQNFETNQLDSWKTFFASEKLRACVAEERWNPVWKHLNTTPGDFLRVLNYRLERIMGDWGKFCRGISNPTMPSKKRAEESSQIGTNASKKAKMTE